MSKSIHLETLKVFMHNNIIYYDVKTNTCQITFMLWSLCCFFFVIGQFCGQLTVLFFKMPKFELLFKISSHNYYMREQISGYFLSGKCCAYPNKLFEILTMCCFFFLSLWYRVIKMWNFNCPDQLYWLDTHIFNYQRSRSM